MSFVMRGANINSDRIVPPSQYPNYDYNADWYRWTQDLNINLVRMQGSSYVATPFSIKYEPNWATNLDAYLETFSSHGVKVVWGNLGNGFPGTEHDSFGIVQGVTPIADAITMIDKLAGNMSNSSITTDSFTAYGNNLGKNFLTDPRVWGWSIGNEPDLTDANLVNNWYIPLLDYIRSRGGKSWVSAPWSDWNDPKRPAQTPEHPKYGIYWNAYEYDQILGDHSDVVEVHYYGEYEYVQGFHYGTTQWISPLWGTYNTLYDFLLERYRESVSIPRFPPEKCFLGEFGCWYGYGNREGLDLDGATATFTNQDRMNVYTAHLNAARDAGLKNLTFLALYGASNTVNPDGTPINNPQNPNYGICYPVLSQEYTGYPSYYDANLASLIRTRFASPTPITLPFQDNFADLNKWTPINGTWSV